MVFSATIGRVCLYVLASHESTYLARNGWHFYEEPKMIKGLHHNAYRCRDSEQTREFYEDFLELPLADAFEIKQTQTGRQTKVLHSFFQMDDGSFLAFFEVPDRPFEFKEQHDFDLHIALEVDEDTLNRMFEKGKRNGMEPRGISDHGFIHSIYFRDPNGYVIELAARTSERDEAKGRINARETLARWQLDKRTASGA